MSREETLLKRIQHGDSSCLDEWIALYYSDIFRYCLWHTKDRQTAEDAVQETFLKVIGHFDCIAKSRKRRAYIYKVASNVCIDLWRKKSDQEIPEETAYFDKGYEKAEADTDFLQLVDDLPADQRKIVILRFGQDLTMREIAEILDLPLRTVQSRLRSSLKKMKKKYKEGGRIYD